VTRTRTRAEVVAEITRLVDTGMPAEAVAEHMRTTASDAELAEWAGWMLADADAARRERGPEEASPP
jgi:hypothetical protein